MVLGFNSLVSILLKFGIEFKFFHLALSVAFGILDLLVHFGECSFLKFHGKIFDIFTSLLLFIVILKSFDPIINFLQLLPFNLILFLTRLFNLLIGNFLIRILFLHKILTNLSTLSRAGLLLRYYCLNI